MSYSVKAGDEGTFMNLPPGRYELTGGVTYRLFIEATTVTFFAKTLEDGTVDLGELNARQERKETVVCMDIPKEAIPQLLSFVCKWPDAFAKLPEQKPKVKR